MFSKVLIFERNTPNIFRGKDMMYSRRFEAPGHEEAVASGQRSSRQWPRAGGCWSWEQTQSVFSVLLNLLENFCNKRFFLKKTGWCNRMMTRVSDREKNQGSLSEEVTFQVEWQGASHLRMQARGISGSGNKDNVPKITRRRLRNNPAKPCKMPLIHFLNYMISQEKMFN